MAETELRPAVGTKPNMEGRGSLGESLDFPFFGSYSQYDICRHFTMPYGGVDTLTSFQK